MFSQAIQYKPPPRLVEGFTNVTCQTALTEYYTNTFVPGSRFLAASELTELRDLSGISTSFHQVARKAAFALGGTPRLTGSDTNDSVEALMNAATKVLTSRLITTYNSVYTTWNDRGITGLVKATTTTDPLTSDMVNVFDVRTLFVGTHWPELITKIKDLVKNISITNATSAYGFLTGSPSGAGKMARSANTKPLAVTLDASGAILYGSHTGGTSFGFYWSTSTMETGVSGTLVSGILATKGFTGTLTELTSGTLYYYKAYATNTAGTNYGIERSFVYAVAPTVGALTITRSPTALTITGTFTNGGGSRILEKGIVWATTATAPTNWVTSLDTVATRTIEVAGDTTPWTSVISGLTPSISYTFVGYARNGVGSVVSSAMTATFPSIPTLSTPTASASTTASITVSSSISAFGTATNLAGVSECGFLWSTTQATIDSLTSVPAYSSSTTVGLSNNTVITNVFRIQLATNATPILSILTNSTVTYNTPIYVRSYVITNTEGTALSERASGTTIDAALPTVTTTSLIPTSLSVTFSGNITAHGGANITERGILYVASPAASMTSLTKTTTDVVVIEDIPNSLVTGTFTQSAVTLVESKKYFYVAYATNIKGTRYGSILNFTSPSVPTINNNNYTSTRSQITVSGTIASIGGGTMTFSGIVYSTTNMTPTILDTVVNATSPTVSTKWSVSFAADNTTAVYYVRAYVTTGVGTGYSGVLETSGFSVSTSASTTTNGGHKLYAFPSANSFVVTGRNIINYFVVGGGGGGGNSGTDRTGGGGGAGGYLRNYTTLFAGGSYTVTVGAGGLADSNGVDSSISGPSGFTTLTAIGGGKGAGLLFASIGGSGGGARHMTSSGAAGITNQGSSGAGGYDGVGNDNAQYAGGGGGGAGFGGGAGSTTTGGKGGDGILNNIPGWNITIGAISFPSYYCGGGGGGFQNRAAETGTGGSGGIGGGGTGAQALGKNTTTILSTSSIVATSGTLYSGGGGGGCTYGSSRVGTTGGDANPQAGGAGGSGVVFISINSSFL